MLPADDEAGTVLQDKAGTDTDTEAGAAATSASGLPPYKLILAPMVGGSELAYRMLCRKYGADLCYTPMMYANKFAEDKEYRAKEFHTHKLDRPLAVHFCGNDPKVLLKVHSPITCRPPSRP